MLEEGHGDEKEFLGMKGASICTMNKLNIPVPPACIISSESSTEYIRTGTNSEDLLDQIREALRLIEVKSGRIFGNIDGNKFPLLLAIRSSPTISMPGMLESCLNIGMNEQVMQCIAGSVHISRCTFDI
jgi:pyruvate,orthophosphate dikinase